MIYSLLRFLRTTVLGGILVLLPLLGVLFFAWTTIKFVLDIITPLNRLLPIQSVGGVAIIDLLAFAIFLGLCFSLGLLVQTAGGRWVGRWFEQLALNPLPGYRIFKRLSLQIAGRTEEALGAPVLIKLGETRQIGFLVEQLSSGEFAVFVPLAPVLYFGSLHLVRPENVERLDVPMTKVVAFVSSFGVGASHLLPGKSS